MDEDVQIDLTPNSNNTSKDDENRRELLWAPNDCNYYNNSNEFATNVRNKIKRGI